MVEFRLQTLTPLWFGGVDPTEKARLHETGLIGSLRWWYEAVVRGLGGYACDPTDRDHREHRCHEGTTRARCGACEMFGCEGWAKKFILRVTGGNGQPQLGPLEKGQEFGIQLLFTRTVADEELWLWIRTLDIICAHGSIGGDEVR